MNKYTVPRLVLDSLRERLKVMPAVVLSGARQTGKSTLAKELEPVKRKYFTLDDIDVMDAALRDPAALVGGAKPITLDEIQRAPDLLHAIKREIDRHRRPGRFLLTGSANLLLMRKVSESLAGRASYLTLWPMTRSELRGLGQCGVWNDLVESGNKDWLDLLSARPSAAEDWRVLARLGGYPVPALQFKKSNERTIWFEGYVRTYLERDLQDIASIAALPDFRRVLRAACLRIGQLVNQTEISRDVAVPQPTVHRYLNLLETSYLLVRLPAYSVNRTKRLVKSHKLYSADTGLALYLTDGAAPTGAHLENMILHDLVAWRDARLERAQIFYWRTTIGEEVDFVIETAGRLLPIEVKATTRPSLSDIAHLRTFMSEYGPQAPAGLLLHCGDRLDWIAPNVLAAPWWKVS